MKQIIPFKKELPFMTKVCDITSISLEREINVTEEGIVSGVFHITGDYKMNEGSINREDFSFDLPFDITLDPRYDVNTVNTDIEDFYYDILNEDTLKVNIDLFVEADYLPEPIDVNEEELFDLEDVRVVKEEDNYKEENVRMKEEMIEEIKDDVVDNAYHDICLSDKEEARDDFSDFATDLFSTLDNTETYTTYYVYVVKEEDTVDKILIKYGVSREEFECYNDIVEIKPGSKVIIPKKREE